MFYNIPTEDNGQSWVKNCSNRVWPFQKQISMILNYPNSKLLNFLRDICAHQAIQMVKMKRWANFLETDKGLLEVFQSFFCFWSGVPKTRTHAVDTIVAAGKQLCA